MSLEYLPRSGRLVEVTIHRDEVVTLSGMPAADVLDLLGRLVGARVVVVGAEPPRASRPGASPALLTARETEVLTRIAQGLSNQDIADRLHVSLNTIKSYIRSAYRKLDVTTRSQALLWAVEQGLHLAAVAVPDEEDVTSP